LIFTDKTILGPWIAHRCNAIFTPDNSSTIGWVKNGRIVAGVWYEDYNKVSVTTHIAVEEPLTRRYLNVIFDYPFEQLGVKNIIAPVISDNDLSIAFVKKLGFQEKARLLDVFPTGDLLFFVMTKDKCRYIGERYGKRRRSTPTT
jgi:RimJ/RimL family protein N-acetyltransferase